MFFWDHRLFERINDNVKSGLMSGCGIMKKDPNFVPATPFEGECKIELRYTND